MYESVIEALDGETIVATNVTFEDYLEHYAYDYCEWVDGTVIQLFPAGKSHNALIAYLAFLFQIYFEWKPIGEVIILLFPMKLRVINRGRMPDLIVCINDNPHPSTATFIDGPADICVEVISPESVGRDRGKKFDEYERGGVPEYWLIDPLRKEARFYRLDISGHYQAHDPEEGFYRTPALPGFMLQVSTLWQEKLPLPSAMFAAVEAMKLDSE